MRTDKKNIHSAYLLIDIVCISLSLYLPYHFRYNPGLFWYRLPYLREHLFIFIFWSVFLIIFLKAKNLYSTDRSLTIPKEIWRVLLSVAFASVLAALMIFILQVKIFSRLVFFQSFWLLFLTLFFWRFCKRLLIRYRLSKGFYNHNVLVVGAGKTGALLVKEIENHPHLGLDVVGFFDSYKKGPVAGFQVFSNKIEDLEKIIQEHFVDEIYITIPSQRELVSKVMAVSQKMKKSVSVIADNFTLPFYRLNLNHIGMMPVIEYSESKLHGTELYAKRMLDVLFSAAGLFILFPFFLVIAILIKLDSCGPVFYKSRRCGKKGKLFDFYKFRSMVPDADQHKEGLLCQSEVKGPIFKINNDPRITRLGRLLRRYSIDELPQLFNVLKGDMSLVGPRPPIPAEVSEYDTWQMRRLDVRPGITGLWQVRGRSTLSFYKWVKLDLWYIDNWSFYLDLLILFWTIPAILQRKGAY